MVFRSLNKIQHIQCHFLRSKADFAVINIGSVIMKKGSNENLLGIKVDCNLNFDEDLDGIVKKSHSQSPC